MPNKYKKAAWVALVTLAVIASAMPAAALPGSTGPDVEEFAPWAVVVRWWHDWTAELSGVIEAQTPRIETTAGVDIEPNGAPVLPTETGTNEAGSSIDPDG